MSTFTTTTASQALSKLIDNIAPLYKDRLQMEIEVLSTALTLLHQYEQTFNSISNTLYHHTKDNDHLLDRLTRIGDDLKKETA